LHDIKATSRKSNRRTYCDSGKEDVIELDRAIEQLLLPLIKQFDNALVHHLHGAAFENVNEALDGSAAVKRDRTLKYGGATNKNVHSGLAWLMSMQGCVRLTMSANVSMTIGCWWGLSEVTIEATQPTSSVSTKVTRWYLQQMGLLERNGAGWSEHVAK
jgi:hypothetical protein